MTAVDEATVAAARRTIKAMEAEFVAEPIGALVKRRASLGERIAVDVFDRGETISYAALDRRTDMAANALLAAGVAAGDRVAVMLPNRLAYPVVMLALAKCGAVHVPVNTRYTPREVAYIVGDSGARFAILDAQFQATFAEADVATERTLIVDGTGSDAFDALVDAAPADPLPPVSHDALMNIQYTSGTTGFPKGCMLTQEYWMLIASVANLWHGETLSRFLTAQPFFYMDPQWHLLMTLQQGGTLFVAPRLSATKYFEWVETHGIEWAQVPALAMRQPERANERETTLRFVATFGWDAEACREFRRRFGTTAREAFGMTEIGLGTLMPRELDALYDSTSVGLDGPFRETTIRGENGVPVPPGGRGELWVRGRGLLKGYWNKPDATADVMREADDGGPPWFRTGDVFEADALGFLRIVGRIKDMIRRSSENIAAREVEAIIRELPAVADVAAVAVPDPVRGEEVKIYVEVKDGHALTVDALIDHANRRLAPFKVPRYVAFVDGFPRTVSNKVEKRTLVAGVADLTAGAYDRQDGRWR